MLVEDWRLLLLGENPGNELLRFVRGNVVRRHRDLTPDALATGLDLGGQFVDRAGIALVLGGDVLVGRADKFLVDGMAGHAVLGLGQCLVGQYLAGDTETSGKHHCDMDSFHLDEPFVEIMRERNVAVGKIGALMGIKSLPKPVRI